MDYILCDKITWKDSLLLLANDERRISFGIIN